MYYKIMTVVTSENIEVYSKQKVKLTQNMTFTFVLYYLM